MFNAQKYEKSDKAKARRKRYMQSEKGKATIKKYQQTEKAKAYTRYKIKRRLALNPDIRKSRTAIHNAIRRHKIVAPSLLKCSFCNFQAEHYHHPNGYTIKHRLDIIPLCRKCHQIIHN